MRSVVTEPAMNMFRMLLTAIERSSGEAAYRWLSKANARRPRVAPAKKGATKNRMEIRSAATAAKSKECRVSRNTRDEMTRQAMTP